MPQKPSRVVLVTGPARSGKSEWAETLACQSGQPVLYVATAVNYPEDQEWADRLQRHRQRRPSTWQVIEEPRELSLVLARSGPDQCVLVDSLGTWLANLLELDSPAWNRVEQDLLQTLAGVACQVILVAEEVGWGVVPAFPAGGLFRDRLGTLLRRVALLAEPVYLVVAGHILDLSCLGSPLVSFHRGQEQP